MAPSNSGSKRLSIPHLFNHARNQRGAAAREALENMALAFKIARQDIQNQSIVDTWLREYINNQNMAKRRILELIFHSIDKNKRPLSEEDFVKLESLTLETFNDWLTGIRLVVIPPERRFYMKVFKFMLRAFKEPILLNEEFIRAIHVFLSIKVRSNWKTARYTGSFFAIIMVRIYTSCYQKQPENSDVTTKNRLFEGVKKFMKLVQLSFRDVSYLIRENAIVFYWSLCEKYPAIFVNSSTFHQLSIFLFDRYSYLRLFALKSCHFIMHHENLIGDLDMHRSYLLSALIKTAFDRTKKVAVESIKILTQLYRKYPEECSASEQQTIVPLIFNKDQEIGERAAYLLYVTLKPIEDDAIEFNKHIVSLLHNIEDTLNTNSEVILLRHLLSLAADQLFDWNAWLELFLGDKLSSELANVGCRVLLRIFKYCMSFQLEGDLQFNSLKPLNSLLDQAKQPRLTEEQKNEMECYQEDVTMTFGPNVIQLWDKYKEEECLKHLLKIPQVFVASDTLELKSIFDYLIHLKTGSFECLSEVYQTMASILQLMRTSNKWTADIPALEKYIFSFCGKNFLIVCRRLATVNYTEANTAASDLALLKIAYFVTKYFDLTETELVQNPIIALKYGVAKKNIQIMRNSAYMCLYNVHWQLKTILEKNHSVEERKRREESLRSYIRKTIYFIEPLISFTDSEALVRDIVNIYSQLCISFSAKSEFVSALPGLKMSAIPTLTCEWLHFSLLRQAPLKEVPKDPIEYTMAKCAVQQFCLMLSSGAMDMSYFASILPYFLFYTQPKNYNDVLQQAIKYLIVHEDMCAEIIGALARCRDSYTFEEMQVIVEGVATAGVQKVEVSKVQMFAKSVLTKAIFYICRNKDDLILFPLFLPFVKLLAQQDAKYLASVVLEFHPSLSDDVYVQQFIGGLQSQTHTTST